ncbi:helix-turn-helix transcriptional regulator [Deinococcus roseus]|uniref:HTH-type transcriptional regulator YobV n=1 Tax=Deinococcus roseus TaxID=392414 RepID=A0ABQ2CVX8_9DEIO|nr:YafY family protein [Deinococcus roseus]GGJ22329.1 putative HTH-type transcriptional regulator YobV [Deinococcus roseus]
MDRLTRLLGMLTLLMGTERTTAAELSGRFGVSKRTIYRDIAVLEEAGIPVVLFPGKSGGIGVMEGYALDRSILSQKEVLNLMRLLNSLVQLPMGIEQAQIYEKLQLLLKKNHTDGMPAGWQEIVIDHTAWGSDKADVQKHQVLLQAIRNCQHVQFAYHKPTSDQPELRRVEPYSLILKTGYWYLLGYCHSRGDFRQFRFSRIGNLQMDAETFAPREVPQEMLNIKEHWFRRSPPIKVRFLAEAEGLPRITEWFGTDALKERTPQGSIFEIHAPEDEWLYGLLLQLGEGIEILSPPHLRDVISQKALKIYERYQKLTPWCHTAEVQ